MDMLTKEEFLTELRERIKVAIPIIGEQAIEMNQGVANIGEETSNRSKISEDFNDLMLLGIEWIAKEMHKEFDIKVED